MDRQILPQPEMRGHRWGEGHIMVKEMPPGQRGKLEIFTVPFSLSDMVWISLVTGCSVYYFLCRAELVLNLNLCICDVTGRHPLVFYPSARELDTAHKSEYLLSLLSSRSAGGTQRNLMASMSYLITVSALYMKQWITGRFPLK